MSYTVEAQMLIRKPAAEVFNAFIDPEITQHFWFTRSTGKLKEGAAITWFWDMYDVQANVLVKKITENQQIVIEWGNPATTVSFEFEAVSPDSTYVVIKNSGFNETGDDLIKTLLDNAGGFTTVVDGLKAYLEHGINLNLIADKFPVKSGK